VAIPDEKQSASEKRFQARWLFVWLQTDKKERNGHFSSSARKFCFQWFLWLSQAEIILLVSIFRSENKDTSVYVKLRAGFGIDESAVVIGGGGSFVFFRTRLRRNWDANHKFVWKV
jgi:hypothetical protein